MPHLYVEPLPVVSRLRQYFSRHGYHSRRRLYVQRQGCHKSFVEWQAWKLGTSVVCGRTSKMEPSTPITQGKTGEGHYCQGACGIKNKSMPLHTCTNHSLSNFPQLNTILNWRVRTKWLKKGSDGAVKWGLCYAKEMLLWLPLQITAQSEFNAKERPVNRDDQHCFLFNSAVSAQ